MKLLIILVCLLPLCLRAQSNNVHITATIKGLEAGKTLYIKDWYNHVVDSVLSVANGFTVNMHIPEGEGNSYMLQFGRLNGMPNTVLFLYLEKGTVHIHGNGPMFNEVVLSGPAYINDLNNYHRFIQENVNARNRLYKQADEARKNHDSIRLHTLYSESIAADSVWKVLSGKWIETHPSSPISAYLLSTLYFYNRIEKQEPLFKQLLPTAINNALGKKMKEQVTINDMNGIGKMAPGFSLKDTAGNPVALKDFNGKYVLLDFWASWCIPCRKETPFLKQAMNAYGNKNFTIISVSIDTDTAKWMQAVHHDDMQWTNLLDPSVNRVNGVLHGYYVPSIPTNLLIGPDSKIIARNLRGEALGKKLEQVLK